MTQAHRGTVRKVSGYRLTMPHEWQTIPIQQGSDRAIAQILDRAFARFGRDEVAQYRRILEARLKEVVENARGNGGVDLYVPVGDRERNLPGSFVISIVEFGKLETPPAGRVLDQVLSDIDGGRSVTLDGSSGIRIEKVNPPDPSRDIAYPSRVVEYVLPVPATADGWLVSSFSTLGGGDPGDDFALLLCGLFDAIMSTFRWQYEGEA